MRFLVGLAIGSEWVTGTSMTAEFWPDHARGRGAGLFQNLDRLGAALPRPHVCGSVVSVTDPNLRELVPARIGNDELSQVVEIMNANVDMQRAQKSSHVSV
jgi:hypothetical protein